MVDGTGNPYQAPSSPLVPQEPAQIRATPLFFMNPILFGLLVFVSVLVFFSIIFIIAYAMIYVNVISQL